MRVWTPFMTPPLKTILLRQHKSLAQGWTQTRPAPPRSRTVYPLEFCSGGVKLAMFPDLRTSNCRGLMVDKTCHVLLRCSVLQNGHLELPTTNISRCVYEFFFLATEPYAGSAGLPPPRSASMDKWREEQEAKRRSGPRVKVCTWHGGCCC